MSSLHLDVVTSAEGLEALRGEWDAVFATSADRSVFLTWEWASTWWHHFGGRDRLHLVTVRDGSDLLAVAPFLRATVGRGSVSLAMLVGLGQENGDYGGMLLGPRPGESAELIFSHLEQEIARRPLVVNLTRLRPDGDLLPLLQERYGAGGACARLVQEESDTYPYLDLSGVDDIARLLGKLEVRNDVRRRRKRLRESYDVQFDFSVEPTSAALHSLFTLSNQRWETKSGKMVGVFAGEARQAFVADVARLLFDRGFLRLSLLSADGEPIAARFGFELEGVYLGFKECFEPAFARYGPGHLVVADILATAVDGELREFDFLRGEGEHKSVWANASRQVGYWTLQRSSTAGRAHHALVWQMMRVRARRHPAASPPR